MNDSKFENIELVEKETKEEEKIILLDEEYESKKQGRNTDFGELCWKCSPLFCNISTTSCCPCCFVSYYSCICYVIFLFFSSWFLYGLVATLSFKSPNIQFDFPSQIINSPGKLSEILGYFNQSESVAVFQKSLTFKTIDYEEDHQEFDKLFDFLNESFPLFFSKLEFKKFNFGWMFIWEGSSYDSILMAAHFDVVGAEGQTSWIVDPFSGDIIDGYIYGRGTMDDKSSAVSLMNTVEIMLRKGYSPTKTFYFCFGLDEETNSEGAIEMSEYLQGEGVRPVIALDEGGVVTKNMMKDYGVSEDVVLIGVNEKGYLDMNISCTCEGGHSSTPPINGNCIQLMADGLGELKNGDYPPHTDSEILQMFFEEVFSKSSFFYKIFFGMFRKSKWIMNLAFSKSPQSNALIRTVSSPTIIQGGIANNVLPSYVSAIVNSRTHPMDTIDDVISIMKEKINKENNMEFNIVGNYKSATVDSCMDCREFDLVKQSIDSVFPNTLKTPYLELGATDLFYYKKICEFTYNFSPLVIDGDIDGYDGVHGSNERILVEGYLNMIRFYSAFLRNTELI